MALLACANHEFTPDPMVTACEKCGKSQAEMQWLEAIIESAKTNEGQMGDIYAIPYDGTTIFIHQPVVMSCMACLIYDCDGNRIEYAALDGQKLTQGMNRSNLIFRSTLE